MDSKLPTSRSTSLISRYEFAFMLQSCFFIFSLSIFSIHVYYFEHKLIFRILQIMDSRVLFYNFSNFSQPSLTQIHSVILFRGTLATRILLPSLRTCRTKQKKFTGKLRCMKQRLNILTVASIGARRSPLSSKFGKERQTSLPNLSTLSSERTPPSANVLNASILSLLCWHQKLRKNSRLFGKEGPFTLVM